MHEKGRRAGMFDAATLRDLRMLGFVPFIFVAQRFTSHLAVGTRKKGRTNHEVNVTSLKVRLPFCLGRIDSPR